MKFTRYLIVLLIPLLAACTQPRNATCKRVCAREYECVTATNSSVSFDEKECVAACAALADDPESCRNVLM